VKRVVSVLTAVALILGGCGEDDDSKSKPAKKSNLDIAREVSQVIVDAFINKDEEALYPLFSQQLKNCASVSEQIQNTFDFIDGKIISYDLPTDTGGGGESTEGGRITSQNMTPWIYIYTDSGKTYRIWFQDYLILESKKEAVGVDRIYVSLLDEKLSKVEDVGIDWYQPS